MIKKYFYGIIIFIIALFYFSYIPLSYQFDGTVFSNFLRYSILKDSIEPVVQFHHFLYFPLNFVLYKSLKSFFGYNVLEYFHLQLFSLFFGILTLIVVYKFLQKLIQCNFYPLIGIILLSFSYGFWLFSVEAEVHMPALFFNILGMYLVFFKDSRLRNLLLAALCFGIAAGFHLTNGLIAISIFLILLLKKRRFLDYFYFYIIYTLSLFSQFLIYAVIRKVNVFNYAKNQLFGNDLFAGYRISFWSEISFQSMIKSFQSIGKGILFPANTTMTILSICIFLGFLTVIFAALYKSDNKKMYYKFLFWILPFCIFFSFWDNQNIEFKLNILLPLVVLFVFSFAQLKRKTAGKSLLIILSVVVFFFNFYFVILPANQLENNSNYQLARLIYEKTENDSAIVIAGCGTDLSIHSKIYIPYFAIRQTYILDWMLGRGLSLQEISQILKRDLLSNKSIYFLSELKEKGKALEQLFQHHHINESDFFNFINQFKIKSKIPLIHGIYLIKI